MTIPALIFALLLALLLGALYHLIRGGGSSHLLAYLLAGIVGFAVGYLVGQWREWVLFQFGPLDLGMCIAGGLACLILTDLLLRLPSHSNK